MTGLLAAERQAARHHLLHHVLVADRAPHDVDVRVAQCDLEADVAHHRRHDGAALEPPFALQLAPAHEQHRVAIDDATEVIDEDRAIAVTVERHAHVAAGVDDRFRQSFRMGGAAVEVDVPAIGLVTDDERLEPKITEQTGSNRRRGAVGAVDDQLERPGDRARQPARP